MNETKGIINSRKVHVPFNENNSPKFEICHFIILWKAVSLGKRKIIQQVKN